MKAGSFLFSAHAPARQRIIFLATQKYIMWTDQGILRANTYIRVCVENNKARFDQHADGYFFKQRMDHMFSFVRAANSSSGTAIFAKTHSFHLFKAGEQIQETQSQRVLETVPVLRNKDLLLLDKLEENCIFEIQGISMF